jgi:hypothetical protein
MKIVTQQLGPSRWTAYIEGTMPPYPARAASEQAAIHKLKRDLNRRLRDMEDACAEIRTAQSLLFPT